MTDKTTLVQRLWRQVDGIVGTTELAMMSLRALRDAIQHLKTDDCELFFSQFNTLVHCIRPIRPKFGVLSFQFEYVLREMQRYWKWAQSPEKLKEWTLSRLTDIEVEIDQNNRRLIEYACTLNIHGRNVLVHNHSHTVHKALAELKKAGQKFTVVICKQRSGKTNDNIEAMHKLGIDFKVVPNYILGTVTKEVDAIFFGAIALGGSMCFVTDTGTHEVIMEFQETRRPKYVFITSCKFNLEDSDPFDDQVIYETSRNHPDLDILYRRQSSLYEAIPAKMFDAFVTNFGILNYSELKSVYENRRSNFVTMMDSCPLESRQYIQEMNPKI
jgi:translation initiation factor 2B subunit (eIF-2B alpha/beta/delta family)